MIDIRLKKTFISSSRSEFNIDLQFSIEQTAPVLAIMGASGSGKTSILKMIAGLITPDSGYVEVGKEIWFSKDEKIDLPVQKRKVGFVFQDYALFPHMSVYENLRFADPENESLITELLDLAGVRDLAEELPIQLSGGQKQRIALIRSLLRKPHILLLDEPLSALDTRTRESLRKSLKTIIEEFKVPTLLVTHDSGDADALADTVIELDEGKLISENNF